MIKRPKATQADVDLMQRINQGRPVIDGSQGVFMRWDAVMEALAEARREERQACGVITLNSRCPWEHAGPEHREAWRAAKDSIFSLICARGCAKSDIDA